MANRIVKYSELIVTLDNGNIFGKSDVARIINTALNKVNGTNFLWLPGSGDFTGKQKKSVPLQRPFDSEKLSRCLNARKTQSMKVSPKPASKSYPTSQNINSNSWNKIF